MDSESTSIEELRKSLANIIFRFRRRPSVNQLIVSDMAEDSETSGREQQPPCSLEEAGYTLERMMWERATLRLHDQRDITQTTLTLHLTRERQLAPPFRTVVLLHGTGKSSTCSEMLRHARRFTEKGFLVVLLNSRYHGCRSQPGCREKEHYLNALVDAWRTNCEEHELNCYPFIYDTAADLVSVADYLYSRSDIDRSSLGIAGISLGGMHAWFAAAVDKRWTAVAPLIGLQSFKYAVENDCFHARVDTIRPVFEAAVNDSSGDIVTSDVVRAVWNQICPGLLDKFDAEKSLPLLFPRPVFIGNGELDPRCPMDGVRSAVARARKTCELEFGNTGNFELHIYSGVAHEVTEAMWRDCVHFFEISFTPDTQRNESNGSLHRVLNFDPEPYIRGGESPNGCLT